MHLQKNYNRHKEYFILKTKIYKMLKHRNINTIAMYNDKGNACL